MQPQDNVEGIVVQRKRLMPASDNLGERSGWTWKVIHDALRADPSSP